MRWQDSKEGVNKRPMEVARGKQASKLVLSPAVSLSRSPSQPGEGARGSHPSLAAPRGSPPAGARGEADARGRSCWPHLQEPKLGHSESRAAGYPPRAAQDLALTLRAGSAAPSAPRPPAWQREARRSGVPRPPGTRAAASPARPC